MVTASWGSLSDRQLLAGRDTFLLLWARRYFITAFISFFVLSATVRALLQHDVYQSTVRILPPEANPNSLVAAAMGLMGGGAGAAVGDAFNVKTKGALYLSLLDSRNVQDAIIRRFDLKKAYREKYMYATRRDLEQYTIGAEDRKSGIISITVIDRYPARAAQLANGYVVEMNRVSAESNSGAAHRERVFLDDRLTEVKKDLDQISLQLAEFSSKNRLMDVKNQGQATVAQGAQLQGRIIAAESELRGLQQIYGDDNPRVRAAKASISELRRQLGNIGGDEQLPVSGQLYPSLRQLPLLGVQYADLSRRVTVEETVFEMLTRQDELAKVEEAKELPVLRVLDAAEISEKPTGPKRLRTIALTFVLSAGAGVLVVLFLGYWTSLPGEDSRKILVHWIAQNARRVWIIRVFQ